MPTFRSNLLPQTPALKTADSSETSIHIYQNTWRHILRGRTQTYKSISCEQQVCTSRCQMMTSRIRSKVCTSYRASKSVSWVGYVTVARKSRSRKYQQRCLELKWRRIKGEAVGQRCNLFNDAVSNSQYRSAEWFFFSLALQPQFGPGPTSMKLSVSLRFSRS
jgi:hypothetical protein